MITAAPCDCVFIGGIHGVGKSSLCTEYARLTGITSYTASELIRRHANRDVGLYKEVVNVLGNQDSLVTALRGLPNASPYLLDGHFVIRSKTDGISLIPIATFEMIAPRGIILVTGNPEIAAQRMLERDAKCISATELREMQLLEVNHGRLVAQKLGVKMIELHCPTVTDFVFSVTVLFESSRSKRS